MLRIDWWHTKFPYLGTRKIAKKLKDEGLPVGRKTVRRLMGLMGIHAIYPKANLSKRNFKEAVMRICFAITRLDSLTRYGLSTSHTCLCRTGTCTLQPSSTGTVGRSSPIISRTRWIWPSSCRRSGMPWKSMAFPPY